MGKKCVLGASGGMGYSIVNELTSKGCEVIAFARDRKKLERLFKGKKGVHIVTGNILNREDVIQAAKGCDIIFHAAGVPYTKWQAQLPVMTENIIETSKTHSAKLAIVDNIYAYGQSHGRKVTEDTVKNPHTKKGKLRLQMENKVKESGVPYVIAHFPDFYGPNATNTLLHTTLGNVVLNKKTIYIGDPDIAREYIFTPDGAKALVTLALDDNAYGANWNIPGYGTITGTELIRLVRELTGYKERVSIITKRMIRFVSFFNPFMRKYWKCFICTKNRWY